MPNRIAMGAASWWEPLLAVALTLAAIAGLVVFGGRVYTRAILHTGSTLSLGDAWHGEPTATHAAVPAPVGHEPSAVGATAAGSRAKARRVQLILAVVSLALAGVAFAVTTDFVIGVAAGAGFFALAERGHSGRGSETAPARLEATARNVNRPAASCSVAVKQSCAFTRQRSLVRNQHRSLRGRPGGDADLLHDRELLNRMPLKGPPVEGGPRSPISGLKTHDEAAF